ncbi:thioester reductase domain-containing protein, partial [Actinomadura rubrisoli]
GELYLGGGGVAAGYLNNPQETAKRFVRLKIEAEEVRLYRTGDLVRRLPGGPLQFCGRVDDQVKVRGFRVEIPEVERALTRCRDVAEAAVVAQRDDLSTRLVAFVIYRAGARTHEQEVRRELAQLLPAYMIPEVIRSLERFPIGSIGKIDRAELGRLAAHGSAPARVTDPEQERSVRETVARAWTTTLRTPAANAEEFFDAGGTSLLASRMVAEVIAELELSVRCHQQLIKKLLADPTLRAFTTAVEHAADAGGLEAVDAGRADTNPSEERESWQADARWPETAVAPAVHYPRGTVESTAGTSRSKPTGRRIGTVLLTGATGFLGAHLLRELLDRTSVTVCALVRADDDQAARDRIDRALARYHLEPIDHTRVVTVLGDLAQPRLGLPASMFADLGERSDLIVHCGARVSLALPYRQLCRINVGGTRVLAELAVARDIPMHHVATLGVIGAADTDDAPISEETALPHGGRLQTGYAQSKWVAEKLLHRGVRAGLRLTVHRPAEITASTHTGVWNTPSAFCALFTAITDLQLAPDLDVQLNMVPVDYVARAIVHLSTITAGTIGTDGEGRIAAPAGGGVYHLANPRPARLATMVDRLRAHGHRIRQVPAHRWNQALEHLARHNPAHPTVPFLPLLVHQDDSPGPSRTRMVLGQPPGTLPLPTARIDHALRRSGLTCPFADQPLLDAYIRSMEAGHVIAPAQLALARRSVLSTSRSERP